MFLGVVLFGLFHGLLLLPLLLGIIGPASHRTHFRRSGISQRLELDDDVCDHMMQDTLDIANNFNVDIYEHHARMKEIANRISTIPSYPPAQGNGQLFLDFQSSINGTETLDLTPSQCNDNGTQSSSSVVQESSI